MATGLVDGHLLLHTAGAAGAAKEKFSIKAHDRDNPCRAVRFSLAGDLVVTGSTDKSILAVDVATGKPRARKKNAHSSAVNRLLGIDEHVFASGDDDGAVSLWDSREQNAIATLTPHSDYVADFYYHAPEQSLISVSGDGTLALIDLRSSARYKVKETSEGDADDELLSVTVLKHGKKIVCGTASGVLDIWSWGYWNDCSDRFPGHPDSVTSVVKWDESSVLTGSSDGIIRVLSIQPNKMVGVLGEHGEFDIERMAMSEDGAVLASVSHDNTIKLWDLSILVDDDDSGDDDGEEADEEKEEEEIDESSDDEDDDDTTNTNTKKKKRKKHDDRKELAKKRGKGQHKIHPKKKHGGGGNGGGGRGNFFADLL